MCQIKMINNDNNITDNNNNRSLAPSHLFLMFTQSIKFSTFHFHVLKNTDVWKKGFMKLTENERLLLSASFKAKLEASF